LTAYAKAEKRVAALIRQLADATAAPTKRS